jgi:hypothetical protein
LIFVEDGGPGDGDSEMVEYGTAYHAVAKELIPIFFLKGSLPFELGVECIAPHLAVAWVLVNC